jgi:hypothetical protein
MPTASGSAGFQRPAAGLRAGVMLAPEWAIELGVLGRKLLNKASTYEFRDSANIRHEFRVEDEASESAFDVTGVYSPAALRWFSFGASVGFAQVDAKHTVFPDPVSASAQLPVTENWHGTVPHLGVDVRFDYPVWRGLVLGLRLGIDAAKTKEQLIPQNPFQISPPPPTMIPWIENGWIACVPLDLSVRYVF